ncbi:M23 family metallopeptidase [Parasphingorhabdus sp. JC815]|uniref:M23 family metallopeptidase n=1 Tax=Parasphingorhabdus sp. JC815 TaxID=3232140 RepID=UPI003459E1AC
MHNHKMKGGLLARVNNMFTDREFFMRANGQVRFLTISAQLQKRIAITIGAVIGLWLVVTLAMTVSQLTITGERMALAQKEAAVNSDQSQVAEYKASIDSIAKDLVRRQDAMEQITQQFIGENIVSDKKTGDPAVSLSGPLAKPGKEKPDNSKNISAAFPEAALLARLEARQIAFAQRLTDVALARTARAEAAIRKFGFNPATFITSPASLEGVGGPFIPLFSEDDKKLHPALQRLNSALLRMDKIERTLLTIPSAMPTGISKISSGFGYRSDPFNGGGAMHNGIDFKGSRGQPILAAARGVITHAGWRSGYGKTVEITHGNGLMTRYAHLSKIEVKTGQKVKRGIQVGAMGSTGRSTGTHLHFEVRLNGGAINPRPFLKENTDVLKVQAIARQRADAPKHAAKKPATKKTGTRRG